MKKVIALVATLFAVTAFAQDKAVPVYGKTTPNPVVVPAAEPAVVKKEVAKPAKSTPVKDEKAAGPATKPASK